VFPGFAEASGEAFEGFEDFVLFVRETKICEEFDDRSIVFLLQIEKKESRRRRLGRNTIMVSCSLPNEMGSGIQFLLGSRCRIPGAKS
jgi:hypothetical protein